MIRQKQKIDGEYWYQILINDKLLHQVVNRKPQLFKNVKFYESDPWYKSAEACITNMVLNIFKHNGKFQYENIITLNICTSYRCPYRINTKNANIMSISCHFFCRRNNYIQEPRYLHDKTNVKGLEIVV
jgi:hypothetical protein